MRHTMGLNVVEPSHGPGVYGHRGFRAFGCGSATRRSEPIACTAGHYLTHVLLLNGSRTHWTSSALGYNLCYMSDTLVRVASAERDARLAVVRRDSVIAAALLDGARQVDVSFAAGISQPAISQMMKRRGSHTIGARWTIPVLAKHLRTHEGYSTNEMVRACAQFSSDFRRLVDPIDREVALGAPEATGVPHLDSLVAGLADYEAWRAGLQTPAWAQSSRYAVFPSLFLAPTEGLKAWVVRHTPPQFSVRGVYIDKRDLESV